MIDKPKDDPGGPYRSSVLKEVYGRLLISQVVEPRRRAEAVNPHNEEELKQIAAGKVLSQTLLTAEGDLRNGTFLTTDAQWVEKFNACKSELIEVTGPGREPIIINAELVVMHMINHPDKFPGFADAILEESAKISERLAITPHGRVILVVVK